MANEKLIHVKIGYDEGIKAKKNILSSEISILKILKKIKSYNDLRQKELNLKLKIKKKIKKTKLDIKKLQTILPKVKIPEEIKTREKKSQMIQKIKNKRDNSTLESELQEIQEKLNSLNR
jgi:hypothetical protein